MAGEITVLPEFFKSVEFPGQGHFVIKAMDAIVALAAYKYPFCQDIF